MSPKYRFCHDNAECIFELRWITSHTLHRGRITSVYGAKRRITCVWRQNLDDVINLPKNPGCRMWRNLGFLFFQFIIPTVQVSLFCLAIGNRLLYLINCPLDNIAKFSTYLRVRVCCKSISVVYGVWLRLLAIFGKCHLILLVKTCMKAAWHGTVVSECCHADFKCHNITNFYFTVYISWNMTSWIHITWEIYLSWSFVHPELKVSCYNIIKHLGKVIYIYSNTTTKIPFCIPRKGIARPQSQFPHTFMCLWAIYIFPGSVHIFGIGRPIVVLCKSLTDTWMWKLDWGRAIPFLGIFVLNFGILPLQCTVYCTIHKWGGLAYRTGSLGHDNGGG